MAPQQASSKKKSGSSQEQLDLNNLALSIGKSVLAAGAAYLANHVSAQPRAHGGQPSKVEKSGGSNQNGNASKSILTTVVKSQATSTTKTNNNQPGNSNGSSGGGVKTEQIKQSSSEDLDEIVIAIDARLNKGAGVLKLPKTKKIYFYSIDWSEYLEFPQEPDKFQLVNALLAMDIFSEYIRSYRVDKKRANSSLVCKVANCIVSNVDKAYAGEKNIKYKEWLQQINTKLKSFKGNWKSLMANEDEDVKLANKLADPKRDYSTSNDLPVNFTFPSYDIRNVSKPAKIVQKLDILKEFRKSSQIQKPAQTVSPKDSQPTLSQAMNKLNLPGTSSSSVPQENGLRVSKKSEPGQNHPVSSPSPSLEITTLPEDSDTVVIALEAIKYGAGGLLRFPKTKTIYFYSIKWSEIFHSQTDKLQMMNVLLALEIFKTRVSDMRKNFNGKKQFALLFKGDASRNQIWLNQTAFAGQDKYRELKENIRQRMASKPFDGVWGNRSVNSDSDVQVANSIARGEVNDVLEKLKAIHVSHSVHDLSKSDFSAMHTVALFAPKELLK